jgi:hypothetical protein
MTRKNRGGRVLLAVLVLAGARPATRANAQARTPKNPANSTLASIDRFSAKAGKLQVRAATNGLPGPNEAVDFDRGPFITRGLSPDGTPVRYYNFDVQSTTAAPIYVLFREGESQPVPGQLNIVNVIPGEEGYSDFWQIVKVTVPRDYVANTVTSLAEIREEGWRVQPTTKLVNCPIVPRGSTAKLRLGGESTDLHRGWYRGQVVYYFSFEERELTTTSSGSVPVSPIFVAFRINPNQPNGGPASGFATEQGSQQTHNVVQTLPSNAAYSPLWLVNVYDNADFAKVLGLSTVNQARILATAVATVNCPIVWIAKKSGMR